MEDGMRLWRALLLTLMVAFCAARLQAGPHIIIHDPQAPLSTPVGLNFSFMSDNSGGGVLAFTNTSGVNWFNLYVFTPPPSPIAPITCETDNFSSCFILAGQGGFFATVAFTGATGIMNGDLFFVDLGTGGWAPNATFEAEANHLPEPGTFVLLAGGITSAIARRKLFLR
jgi:hypothetical protein